MTDGRRMSKDRKKEKDLKDKVQGSYIQPPSRIKVDVEQALKLKLKGLSYSEIGDYFGVTPQAIHQRLAKFDKLLSADISEVMAYEANKSSFLSRVEQEILINLLDQDKIKGASLNNLAYAFQQIFNANRLQKGQSTANVSYQDINETLAGIDRELADLEGRTTDPLPEEGVIAEYDMGDVVVV